MNIEGLDKRIKWGATVYYKDGVVVGRKCTECGKDKEISEFSFLNKRKGTYCAKCKECRRKEGKQYHQNNKKRILEKQRQYYENNKECILEKHKQHYENNKECILEKHKQYYNNNKEHIKQYRETNKEHIKKQRKQHYENNKECIKERNKQWRENNKGQIKKYNKQWRENNPNYDKQYRENNKEKIAEYYRQYKETNKEKLIEYNKQYYETIKENNLQYISSLLEQINPMFKQLNLQVYGYVYMFENVKTGHVYIGQTINPLKERYRNSNIVQGWVEERLKYDTQKFKGELIKEDIVVTEVLDVAFCQYHLDKLEAYYIDKYDSYNNGYNNYAGNHNTNDGLEEFNKILSQYNIEFIDGEIKEKRLPKQA